MKRTIEYILDRIEENGPFTGIVGFSSGAAMTAVIASLLEKEEKIDGFLLMVQHSSIIFHALPHNRRTDWIFLVEPPITMVCHLP